MKKEDVENILDLVFKLGKDKLKERVNLVDMYELACCVWEEIKNDQSDDEQDFFLIDKHKIEGFKQRGYLWLTCEDGREIELVYTPYGYPLESGARNICCNRDLSADDVQMLDEFFDESLLETSKSEGLIDPDDCEGAIVSWILENIPTIADLVGFEIKNVQLYKEIKDTIGFYESANLDIYAEDTSGKPIVITGDGRSTTDKSLIWGLTTAIVVGATKIIWVANEVDIDHEVIVKWLNEIHTSRIAMYLVEAKQLQVDAQKKVATGFRLVESPSSGWDDSL